MFTILTGPFRLFIVRYVILNITQWCHIEKWEILSDISKTTRRFNATAEIFRPLNILTNQGTLNLKKRGSGISTVVHPYVER